MSTDLEGIRTQYSADLDRMVSRVEGLRQNYRRWHNFLLIGTYVVVFIVFVCGIVSGVVGANGIAGRVLASIAGAGGLVVGVARSAERTFRLDEKADFYRVLRAEVANVRTALISKTSQEEVEIIGEKIQLLRRRIAQELPKGGGMEAVKQFYEEMDSKGIIAIPKENLADREIVSAVANAPIDERRQAEMTAPPVNSSSA